MTSDNLLFVCLIFGDQFCGHRLGRVSEREHNMLVNGCWIEIEIGHQTLRSCLQTKVYWEPSQIPQHVGIL